MSQIAAGMTFALINIRAEGSIQRSLDGSITSCFWGIDMRILYLRLSPRSTLRYQKQCEIVKPTRMTPDPDPGGSDPGRACPCEKGFSNVQGYSVRTVASVC
ncbi:UNVERIFIED_CONTAM: hypothetical protein FKN15_005819 [Acipenser sinensis]